VILNCLKSNTSTISTLLRSQGLKAEMCFLQKAEIAFESTTNFLHNRPR